MVLCSDGVLIFGIFGKDHRSSVFSEPKYAKPKKNVSSTIRRTRKAYPRPAQPKLKVSPADRPGDSTDALQNAIK